MSILIATGAGACGGGSGVQIWRRISTIKIRQVWMWQGKGLT